MNVISSLSPFRLSNDEWEQLDKLFGKLCKFQAKSLLNVNQKGSTTDDLEDIEQEMRQSMLIAAMYFKRQCYIEECIKIIKIYTKDTISVKIIDNLEFLWKNKTKHGAKRQRFGSQQEQSLNELIEKYVPINKRPVANKPLVFDVKFANYCKSNTWNRIKNLGSRISKERPIRSGLTSLSNYGHLASDRNKLNSSEDYADGTD